LAELREGDVVRVAAGENLPADAELLDAAASFDESLLSGESKPVRHVPGETALAGSLCLDQPARLRVLRTGSRTRMSELTRLVEQAQATRPALSRLADRIASVFVLAMLVCAGVSYAWWRQHDPGRALEVALAVLVVTCPCALSLAIPAALTAAHGRLAAIGVLVLSADALATLARVDRVVFDKTGTLTQPGRSIANMALCAVEDREYLLHVAAALERENRHPIASAFREHDTGLRVERLREVAGAGIEGEIAGQQWRIGRAAFAGADSEDERLWLGDGRHCSASFTLREIIRTDAALALTELRQNGCAVELCSGDAAAAVSSLAADLGIVEASSRQTPEAKLTRIRELQARGEVVAMVGDGINDAPVLAGADVSLAIADGATLAQRAADIVLTSPSLLRIPQALALARRTRRIIKQNLAWAIAYNLLALPLATSGTLKPWQAALGMAASTLLVTLNALRLSRSKD
jgi:Cu2+-exporting ATPase